MNYSVSHCVFLDKFVIDCCIFVGFVFTTFGSWMWWRDCLEQGLLLGEIILSRLEMCAEESPQIWMDHVSWIDLLPHESYLYLQLANFSWKLITIKLCLILLDWIDVCLWLWSCDYCFLSPLCLSICFCDCDVWISLL